MAIFLHQNDLPDDVDFGPMVAVDTETMGLNPARDRLCAMQLSAGDGNAHIVQFSDRKFDAPNLKKLMTNAEVTKIFHFARFDLAAIKTWLGVTTAPVYCTKIASKLTRTYTDRHGLRDLVKELAGGEISKQQQTSDWGAENFTEAQLSYAANDVLYLHVLKTVLDDFLIRENRVEPAQACFDFLPTRADLDMAGWRDEADIFNH